MTAPALRALLFIFAFLATETIETHAATFTKPCGNIARHGTALIEGCVECLNADKSCQLCHLTRVPVWNSAGKITKCNPATEGVAAVAATKDRNCLRADGLWCVLCKAGYFFDGNYRCVATMTGWTKCQGTSKNKNCAACNPDGTCKLCLPGKGYLLSNAAIYINVPSHESRCMPAADVLREARALSFNKGWAHILRCVEYTVDFKCARCVNNWNTAAGGTKCVLSTDVAKGGNGCPATLPYREYCEKCVAGKCVRCGHGRMPFGTTGQCSVNCKQLFGIGCLRCQPGTKLAAAAFPGSAAAPGRCLDVDPLYPSGRR